MRQNLKILLVGDKSRNFHVLDDFSFLEHASDDEQTLLKIITFAADLILVDGMIPGKTDTLCN